MERPITVLQYIPVLLLMKL